MGNWLREQWEHIRGDAKWWALTTAPVVLMTAITTAWGYAQNLPGPYLLLLALGALAVCLAIAALCVFIATRLRQWERNALPPPYTPAPDCAAKDREIEDLKESIKQLTSREARSRITQEVLDERWHRLRTMSPEERKQMDEKIRKRDEEWERERQPLELTTKIVLKSISLLSKNPTKPPIKIVSTPEHMEWATQLAEIFRLSKYELLTSREATNNIFPAKVKHDRLIMRFRAKDEQLLGDKQEFDTGEKFDEEKSQKTFKEIDRYSGCLNTGQAEALMGFEHREFDNSDSRDYFQIEIKGAP